MHKGPNPIFHRDIRWPNVIKRADDPTKWFLIDWDDAAQLPTIAATHLDRDSHAPTVFNNNHGPEVDTWAVGKLITESSRTFMSLPPDLLTVGTAMMKGKLSVPRAMERIAALKAI